jgi:hypothetical protein
MTLAQNQAACDRLPESGSAFAAVAADGFTKTLLRGPGENRS